MKYPALTIVIPVYNEAANILSTLHELDSSCPIPATVLVVYDFPEDNTVPALANYRGQKLDVQPRLNTLGKGVVNAIKFGLGLATTEAILVVMADLSDDLKILPKMLEDIATGSELVCGSRYMRGGRHVGGPKLKKMLSRLAGVSLYHLAGIPTHDITNSFKMYTQKVLNAIDLESQGGFEVAMEITVKAWILGFRITEIPSVWRDRTAGESRFRMWAWLPYYLRWYFVAMRHRVQSFKTGLD